MQQSDFLSALYRWSDEHPRPMPWRSEPDPYKVWISEIMLQQTRVEQATGFYQRFLARFPSVQSLAEAPEIDVLKHWEGLGYNSRARNVHAAAKQIAFNLQGVFPDTYENLLSLKGIGPYTASAIASFAFGEARPVLDTNVVRIVCRMLGLEEAIDLPATQQAINAQVAAWFDTTAPARYNQAIMDFGAMQCLPRQPECGTCPMNTACVGYKMGIQDKLPVKPPKKERKSVRFYYAVIQTEQGVCIVQRTDKDIWKGMFTFPEMEAETATNLLPGNVTNWAGGTFTVSAISQTYRQTLTHRQVEAIFMLLQPEKTWLCPPDWTIATIYEINKYYPVPGIIRDFITNFDATK